MLKAATYCTLTEVYVLYEYTTWAVCRSGCFRSRNIDGGDARVMMMMKYELTTLRHVVTLASSLEQLAALAHVARNQLSSARLERVAAGGAAGAPR